jgi:hypothetical protein
MFLPGINERPRTMTPLARRIETALEFFRPRYEPVTLGESANDNLSVKALAAYVRDCRAYSSEDYVPSGAKSWWLP